VARRYTEDEKLNVYNLDGFLKGYNSYTQGKSTVADNEYPYGLNIVPDFNGSNTKRTGRARYSAKVASGHSLYGVGILKNTTYNKLIVASNTAWYDIGSGTSTALTGVSFTADLPTDFCQAVDRLYGANGTDNLAYTNDGATITSVSANGNIGRYPVFYNQRMYMTNTAYPDRIYYSNPITATESSYAIGNFGTFNTDLSATPKKNAGFIILIPGGGVEITRLFKDNQSGVDYLYVYTKKHGVWRIVYSSVNADGSIAHTIVQTIITGGSPAGKSVIKVANDQWFFGGDNYYTLGEIAQFQNVRVSTKSGRIRSEMQSIPSAYKQNTSAGFYKERIYIAYTIGTYNDRYFIYDIRLNAWSSPCTGNFNEFIEWEDNNSVIHFLGLSSNPADSYVYELETGTNDISTAINGYFETKSTNCGKPGLMKYFGFIDVFYTTLYGKITYEVFINETLSITGELQVGNSSSLPIGIGSQIVGTFIIGKEYNPNTTFIYSDFNNNFRIDCGYVNGKKISVRFTNNNSGEQMTIDALVIYYLDGSIFQT